MSRSIARDFVPASTRPSRSVTAVSGQGRTHSRSKPMAGWGLVLLFTLLVGLAGACGKGPTIPGTEIPDTEENRAVINALESYRIAFVRRDPVGVMASAHPTYYDTAGTDDPADDITYQELGPILRERMAQLESVRFTIDYLEVHVHKDRAVVKVWIDASFRLLPTETAPEDSRLASRFSRVQDHNMFELVREGESWLISAGM